MLSFRKTKGNLFSLSNIFLLVLVVFLFMIVGLCFLIMFYSSNYSGNPGLNRVVRPTELDLAYKSIVARPLSDYINLFSTTGDFPLDNLKTATAGLKQELLALKVSEKMKDYHLSLFLILNKIQVDIDNKDNGALKTDFEAIKNLFKKLSTI